MKITKCDKCGKTKPANRDKQQGWVSGNCSVDSDYHSFDLCSKCGPKLVKNILQTIK